MNQQKLDDIRGRVGFVINGGDGVSVWPFVVVEREDIDALFRTAQAFVDTADHVVISKVEYDWLVQRSYRLDAIEPLFS